MNFTRAIKTNLDELEAAVVRIEASASRATGYPLGMLDGFRALLDAEAILAGGPGSGCHGDNCGRPAGPGNSKELSKPAAAYITTHTLLKRLGWSKTAEKGQLKGQPALVYDHPKYGKLWVTKNRFAHFDNLGGLVKEEGQKNVGGKPQIMREQLANYLGAVHKAPAVGPAQPEPPKPDQPSPQPVPSSVHAVESHLKTAPVKSVKQLGGGVSVTKKITLDDGSHAVFKPHIGEAPGMRMNVSDGFQTEREVGAWEVAKLVGMDDLVQPTVRRAVYVDADFGTQTGSLQAWTHGTGAINIFGERKYDGSKDLTRAATFDFIIGNEDRHAGNWMVDEGKNNKLRLIDHGLSFPDKAEYYNSNHAFLKQMGRHEEHDDASRPLQSPREAAAVYVEKKLEIVHALTQLGLPKGSVEGVVRRIDAMAVHRGNWTELNRKYPHKW